MYSHHSITLKVEVDIAHICISVYQCKHGVKQQTINTKRFWGNEYTEKYSIYSVKIQYVQKICIYSFEKKMKFIPANICIPIQNNTQL